MSALSEHTLTPSQEPPVPLLPCQPSEKEEIDEEIEAKAPSSDVRGAAGKLSLDLGDVHPLFQHGMGWCGVCKVSARLCSPWLL